MHATRDCFPSRRTTAWTVEAEPVDSAEEIARRLRDTTEVVAVDEAQFLDDGIVDMANRLADRGVRVILAGTDVDFRGLPFGPMPTLMCVAEVVDKFQAICVVCGGPATRNQRLVNGKPGALGQSHHHGRWARVV
jgi:thymidine kinase